MQALLESAALGQQIREALQLRRRRVLPSELPVVYRGALEGHCEAEVVQGLLARLKEVLGVATDTEVGIGR
jgi:hypothetical protein